MAEPTDDERYLRRMFVVRIVGGAEECGASTVAVDIAHHVPVRVQDRVAVDEPGGRGLVNDGQVQRELTGGLVPEHERGRFVRQRRAEVIEDRGEKLAWGQSTAQIGPWSADAAVGKVGRDRRRNRHIECQPRSAQNEHDAVIPDGKAVAGPGRAKRVERGRSATGRDRVDGNGGEQRGRRRIIGEHGHHWILSAINAPTVIGSLDGRRGWRQEPGLKGLRRLT